MYRDMAQWTGIRHPILREGVSISQVVRETRISRKTIRKMLNHPRPKPYGPRGRRYPKLGPHGHRQANAPGERYSAALGSALHQDHL